VKKFLFFASSTVVALALSASSLFAGDTEAACVRVSWKQYTCSGFCVACEGGKSLVVTNNHLFSETHGPDGQFPRANYPLAGTVATLDGKKTFKATAIDGDKDADLAFVVVEGELPVAELADSDAPPDTPVWHRGIGSGGGKGVVLLKGTHDQPKHNFASTTPSTSGDSGAALFDENGKVVAVNCGRHAESTGAAQRGTPITPVRNLLRGVAKTAFPNLSERLGKEVEPKAQPAPKKEMPKVAAAPKAEPVTYEYWSYQGKIYAVPKGSTPWFAAPNKTLPSAPSCPSGNCPRR
jgi:S1-C subfamily serine protease